MKTILHLATSSDGFIARENGDSDWVDAADEVLFKGRAVEAGCVVVGRKTFEQYQGIIYPIRNAINIILGTNHNNTKFENTFYVSSPEAAISLASENGCRGVLIAGGTRTSTSFLLENMIDEIFFSVHPVILSQGMKPFDGMLVPKSLELLNSRSLENGLVELHYRVLK